MMNAKRSSKFTLTRYAFLVPAVVALLLVFSISKAALVTKSAGTYKAIVAAMHKGGLTDDKNINTVTAANKRPGQNAPFLTASSLNIQSNLSLSKIADTIKKGDVFISTNERTDSLNYVINGVKVTKADFKALDPDKIYAVEFMSSEQSGKLLDHLDNGHSTLFITTDDSETGKKFKEKIDALNDNRYVLSSKLMTFKNNSTVAIAGSPEGWALNTARGSYSVSKRSKAHTLKADDMIADSGGYAPTVLEYHVSPGDSSQVYTIFGHGSSSNTKPVTVRGRKAPMAMAYSVKGFKTAPFKTYTSTWSGDEETNISHLSTKLIMIDGKEATEKDLKKLSAADIESMSVKSGDDVAEKYGDKAKNGVLFITTKKASK